MRVHPCTNVCRYSRQPYSVVMIVMHRGRRPTITSSDPRRKIYNPRSSGIIERGTSVSFTRLACGGSFILPVHVRHLLLGLGELQYLHLARVTSIGHRHGSSYDCFLLSFRRSLRIGRGGNAYRARDKDRESLPPEVNRKFLWEGLHST